MSVKHKCAKDIKSEYGTTLDFWIFQIDQRNCVLEFGAPGSKNQLLGLKYSDCVRVAAAIMRLNGGDVYEIREDAESEMGHE